jgi:oxygen-independent coproporphyrinogen-3 oxidase
LAFDIPHISAYALTIEDSTRLGKMRELGRLSEAEDEEVARQALHLQGRLETAGLIRYELSNYARPGAEALHNTNYWEHVSYMGLGPGAHSLYHEAGMAWRWHNAKDLKAWMEDPVGARSLPEELEPLQRAEEYILLRLRNASGLDIDLLAEEYQYELSPAQREYWSMLQVMGLAMEGSPWRLSAEGFNVADRITVELITRGDEL